MSLSDITLVIKDGKDNAVKIESKTEEEIQVKYELDTVQNLKKAKSNLSRGTELKCVPIDDENIKFEVHPGIYLEIKDKAKEIRQGLEFEDAEIGVKVRVSRTRRSVTKKNKEIPENAIWYEVTDTRTGSTTKCVQKLYHTTQTIHLQGGERFGKTTTTAIMADYLEKEWMEIIETEKDKIEFNTKMLANRDITKLQENKRAKFTKKPDSKCTCTMCPYTSKFLYQLKIHMYTHHQITDTKAIKKSCVKSLSNQSVKKEEAVKRVRIANPVISNRVTEPKEEYINHYHTPKTSPEPSPVKKRVKENPTKEVVTTKDNEVCTIKNDSNKDQNKVTKDEGNSNNDEVENEVAGLVQNLQDELETKGKRIKFLEIEKLGLENKIKNMTFELKTSKEVTNKIEQEKETLHLEYAKCCKANQVATKETEKVKAEYVECAQQLNFAQRRSEQLAETLKVTEAILQAQEEEDDDEEDDDIDTGNEVDDDDFLEDEDHPGQLWKVVQQEFNCKKCDEKVIGNKNLREHMQKHIKDQNEVLPCYYCEFKTGSENEFLHHISSVHGAGHTCLTCNNTFRTQEEMIKHVVDTHPKAKPKVTEKCVTCGQEFEKVERLTEHILRQHTMLTASGQANIAGQQLVKIWPLQESLQNQGNIKWYDCESMFHNKDILMKHKK